MMTRSRVFLALVAMFAILMLNAPLAEAQDGPKTPAHFSDYLKSPQSARRDALRKEAFHAQLQGKASGEIYTNAEGKSAELKVTGTDLIWTVLGEFGNKVDPTYGGHEGPKHNQIKEPNRRADNSTIWRKNFNEKFYEKLLFNDKSGANSMRNYYLEQSSGMYTVDGDVTDWVKLKNNAAYYGSNYCGGIVCQRTWLFVQDSLDQWYKDQKDAGMSDSEINDYLAQFDVWDRYDYDFDNNFNEPDGYIDHFQAIHAGEGEETGGGPQGTDAIWSHRWFAYYNLIGSDGPSFNKFGGVQVGDSDFWVGDYTVEPENGGLGVFAHEFGHDLGLPDLYDVSGNTGGAENSVAFWSLYSSGSYGSNGKAKAGIGSKPTHMSALEKVMLGWSNYLIGVLGQEGQVRLGPAEKITSDAQMLFYILPDNEYTTSIGDAYAGTYFYYSDSGNDLDNTMTKSFTLPAGTVTLSAKARYDIEEDWDYAYLLVDGTEVHTNLSTASDPNGQNFGEGITGSTNGDWVDLTADLSAYAGQTVDIEFRYWTDSFVAHSGFGVDELAITGQTTDGAESDTGWTLDGFLRSNGEIEQAAFNAYMVENRQYYLYDKSLKSGPYNFGFLDKPELGNLVEHFPYQNGMLVWYYNEEFEDNSVGDYCAADNCGGLFLPVDAHPKLLMRPDGQVWRPRIQAYDSTFGLQDTDPICLHYNSVEKCYPSLQANDTFNDAESYWVAPNPSIGNFGWASVPIPTWGLKIKVLAQDDAARTMDIDIIVTGSVAKSKIGSK